MEYKKLLDKQEEDEIKSMFNWMKKSKKHVDLSNNTHSRYCNNYATHCCLNCDRCWGGKPKV